MRVPPPPVESPLEAIGNTPVVRLRKVVPDGHANLYLKLESFNPTGSYKDRMAKPLIEEAERRGELKPGMTVVEATGGSTGSALAFVCAAKGYNFHVVSSNAFAQEKLRTMSAFGATVDTVPSACVTADLIPRMNERAQEVEGQGNCYRTNQFTNRDAFVGYTEMAGELVQQFPGGIDAFCGMAGTAGMVIGVARALKRKWPQIRVVVCEPDGSPVLTEGRPGNHHVEGTGIGYVPPLLDSACYDEARAISESEGRQMARRLAREEGLMVGTSSGLNVVAAIALAKELGPGKTVVTVACDTGLKYLNGDLFADA
ncbi:tryptophan synthase beta subunit-like PLP-dependent enzyme [Macrophomina phaseolina]|uniref:Tryptophan synthase beta subunit-like PLP-dependent enzyme n=1 Tax=Macrophomina phaseolina TaxID=35725 RepID=A0ABQ8FRW9_9PEZI|nr:tryptophan synthase beta subunit-like PLP-dependent enzyme [Macrophomina phaseolina]